MFGKKQTRKNEIAKKCYIYLIIDAEKCIFVAQYNDK